MSDLYQDCPRCGGNGGIVDDAGFYDLCPDCLSSGVVKVEPAARVEVYTINVTKNIEFIESDNVPDGKYMLVKVNDE